MKEIIQFAEYTLEIWRRPRQRHMHLTVRDMDHLRVTCNKRVAKRQILAFVDQSQEFIARRRLQIEAHKKRFPPKQLLSDELWLWKGQSMPLEVLWGWGERISLLVQDGKLELKAPLKSTRDQRLEAVWGFYRRQARRDLPGRLKEHGQRMQAPPFRLSIRGQATRWGSCSSSAQISLNWKLMAAPEWVIDYVVVHELAHLWHMNHSRRFWALVAEFHPQWRQAKQWLTEHEAEIAAQFRA